MYHIRRVDTKEERSIHIENADGLIGAVSEAKIRTTYSRVPHEVVDDTDKRVALVCVEEPDTLVTEKVTAKRALTPRAPYRKLWFWVSAAFAAELLAAWLGH